MTEATTAVAAAPTPGTGAVLTTPISIREAVLAQFREAEPTIQALADKYRDVAYAVATPKGMKEAVAARADLRDNGRLLLTRTETRIKGEVNDLKRTMADEVERLVGVVKPIEEHVDAQIKAEEKRKADEKAAREKAEADRVAQHRQNLEKLRAYADQAKGQPVEAIERAIAALEALQFGEEWEEFATAAALTRESTVAALRALAQTERTRLENERLARELAEAKAALAAATAQAAAPAPGTPAPTAAHAQQMTLEATAPAPVQAAPSSTPEAVAHAPVAPAPVPAVRHAPPRSEVQQRAPMAQLIVDGQTMTIGAINAALGLLKIDGETLVAVGIIIERSRGAVHMATEDFTALCNLLIAHIEDVRDSTAKA
ncbi:MULTISPECIES: hypothetical protein [Delftia]|uniref:hypothetical protein n=1 Tax=Delftia TaxID=80865 RepID=UPI00259CB319|nr:hypothetical protein [Delftia sp.]